MMKRAIAFACVVVLLVSSTARAEEGKKTVKYGLVLPMSAEVLKNIQPKRDLPSYITKTAEGLKIDKKHKRMFVILENHALLVPTELATEANEPVFETYFAAFRVDVKDDLSMFITYCSCGSRITEAEGDNCGAQVINNVPQCWGSCTGRVEGETCSFTTAHYPPDGDGQPRVRDRGTSL